MPVVHVDAEWLHKRVGKSFTVAEFEDLCFEFGIELEEATSEREIAEKELGAAAAAAARKKSKTAWSENIIYKIDIPANRYDLLCGEGISRALKAYLQIEMPPTYTTLPGSAIMTIHPSTFPLRPHIVCAILRDVTFDPAVYESFIELQDKLHNNICRKRTLVAIGTHDLDMVEGPFTYEALAPKDISFTPLGQDRAVKGTEFIEFYEADRKLSKFLHIIRDSPVFPVVLDAKRRILSLPPIINSDHSKIRLTTKNVLIECTATDLTKAKIVLNTMVTMFSEYCKKPFTVETVEVLGGPSGPLTTPDLSSRTVSTKVSEVNSKIGIDIAGQEMTTLLSKMSLQAALDAKDPETLVVSVPPTRSDVLHACDVVEDVAIAFGFNNIAETHPKCNTIASPLPVNKLADFLRVELALAGYTEALSFTLCSDDENFRFLRKQSKGEAVVLANPKTVEYQVVRTSLLPGLLKTVSCNQSLPLPIQVFEVSDVVFHDPTTDTRSRNERHLCALYANTAGEFQVIHGLLDRLMTKLHVPADKATGFTIQEVVEGGDASGDDASAYFPGLSARVLYRGLVIGAFGLLHPETLGAFDLPFPVSGLELNIEPFV